MAGGARGVARSGVERAEAQLARADERTQPELFGQTQRRLVVLARGPDVRHGAEGRDVAQDLQRLRLVATLAAFAREIESLTRRLERLLVSAGRQQPFREVHEPRREVGADSQLAAQRHALLEQAQPLVHVPHAHEREAEQR